MKVGRRNWLVLAIALASVGCRAAGTGSLALHPRPILPIGTLDVEEFVASHNRNSELIRSLEAKPAIKVAMPKRPTVHVDGHMALERPRNFRLELSSFGTSKADIGSNADEFWFWVSSRDDPSLYWCNYADLESSPLAVTYQPDWIIEAMGLKSIPLGEVGQIQVQKGPDPGTTAFIFPTTRNRTESFKRVLIVSNRERRIKQLRIYTAADPPVLIAQAEPSHYKEYAAKPGETVATKPTCYLPEKLVLEWKRDQPMKLEVVLLEVQLNEFDPTRSTVLFTEPKIEGYQRRNLAELSHGARQQGRRTTTRQTMPVPSARNGVELGRPTPLNDDDPVVPKLGGVAVEPPDPPPAVPPLEDLVGSPLPTPPESAAIRAARAAASPPEGFTIER